MLKRKGISSLALLALVLLLTPAYVQPQSSEAPPAVAETAHAHGVGIRTDGVYALVYPDQEASSAGASLRHRVVRLYADGSAVEADVTGDPTATVNWLSRESDELLPGLWTLEGDELSVSTSTGFEETSRKGKLVPAGWEITSQILFRFLPVAFPEPAGGNRRPYFVGPGNGMQEMDYDSAGVLVGINHRLEIEAVDPEGDQLTYSWVVSNGSIAAEGPRAVWKRVIAVDVPMPGQVTVEPGTVTVTVTDAQGGRITSSSVVN